MRLTSSSSSLALTCAIVVACSLAGAAPVEAQTLNGPGPDAAALSSLTPPASIPSSLSFDDQQRAYRRGTRGSSDVGVRVFGFVDLEHMKASQSFDAVVGSSTLLGFGGGADITGLGGGLFLRLALSEMSKSGTRSDGSQFGNGIAVNVKMLPVDLAVGWRFDHLVAGNSVTPYVGGGALLLRYSEVTPSGDTGDNTSQFFFGYEAFGGVDVRVTPVLTVAPEVSFRAVPNAIGKGGVSQTFNETDLGGLTFRISVGARFGGSH